MRETPFVKKGCPAEYLSTVFFGGVQGEPFFKKVPMPESPPCFLGRAREGIFEKIPSRNKSYPYKYARYRVLCAPFLKNGLSAYFLHPIPVSGNMNYGVNYCCKYCTKQWRPSGNIKIFIFRQPIPANLLKTLLKVLKTP